MYQKYVILFQLFVYSAYQPKNSAVFPVYNPLPGSWFVAAYLETFSETLGFKHKCKYSLGSIGKILRTKIVWYFLISLDSACLNDWDKSGFNEFQTFGAQWYQVDLNFTLKLYHKLNFGQ